LLIEKTFFQIDRKQNYGLKILQSNFNNILFPGESQLLEPFPLDFFKMNIFEDGFISYIGSLTTPPCSEVVIWLLSVNIQSVSTKQVMKLTKKCLN
jgi:carbonic anhydrase